MELPDSFWLFIIKVTLFLRPPLLLNFQIPCSKMSPFPWEELQGSLLLQLALPPGQKLCTTAAGMGAKTVAYFSPSDILTLQEGCWAEVVTSGVLSLPLNMEPPPLWAIWDKSDQVPSIPSLSWVVRFPPHEWGLGRWREPHTSLPLLPRIELLQHKLVEK